MQYYTVTKILEKYRRSLLMRAHDEEKKIDCLDYLICQLSRRNTAEGGVRDGNY